MRRTGGWTAQALLACCAVLYAATEVAAVEQVSLIALHWTAGASDPVTVCANATLDEDGDIRLLVSVGDGMQTNYGGTPQNEICATFTDLPPPTPGQTSAYELIVTDSDGNTLQQALTIFTLMGEEITCGESHFVRITSGSLNTSTDVLACLPDASVCYSGVPADTPADVCIYDLDPEYSPELLVCTPTSVFLPSAAADITGTFVADTLTYAGSTGSFDVSGFDLPTFMMELLSRTQGEADLTVSACENDVCTLEAFTPSSSIYELCGVLGGNTTSTVASVGTATFQDIMLKVDTSEVPINFHFVRPPGDGIYEVYHGPNSAFESGPTILDCSRLPDNSYCYGVVVQDSSYLAVSSANKSNSVVAPVGQSVKFFPKY